MGNGNTWKMLCVLALGAVCALGSGSLTIFGHKWTVPDAADWKTTTEGGAPVLELARERGPLPGARRPIQFALADTPPFHKVAVELDARPLGKSIMIVFAYRDAAHFDYAHLSIDAATKEAHHNGIFHVYDGERVRISPENGPPAFGASGHWYHARLDWDGGTGAVSVKVGGKEIPALHAVDLSLREGKVGIGSFDETADFKNVRIVGE